MADQDGEIDFSDNDLDGLPQSTLQDLEYNAISSTQQQVAALRTKNYNRVTRPFKLSAPTTTWQQSVVTRPTAPPPPEPPSSDYGLDDEDVIDLDERSLLPQPASIPAQHEAVGLKDHGYLTELHTDIDHADSAPVYAAQGNHAEQQQHSVSHDHGHARYEPVEQARTNPSVWEVRIKDLEREKAALRKTLQDAETAALKSAGEIAILRAKHDKNAKEYERKIAVLQKIHADETAKHRAEAQAARKDRETVETNNRFLEHDLAQEVERVKRFKAAKDSIGDGSHRKPYQRSGTLPSPGQAVDTSHRQSQLPYRDGFDDHEIVLISPSKPKDKPKAETPKAGDKRKRKVNASPIAPLMLETTATKSSPSVVGTDEGRSENVVSGQKNVDEFRFRTIQQIISHRPPYTHERTLETLTNYKFPSTPEQSVAGLVLDSLTSYIPTKENADLPLYVCNFVLDLWSKCLEDHYYGPLHALADLLEFVLASGPRSAADGLIERFVPLATQSIDLIAMPLARPEQSPDAGKTGTKSEVAPAISEEINVDHILSITCDMATTASLSAETTRAFWQKMEFDFTLMMLNIPQQLPYMQLVLRMLSASVLPESFGVISRKPEKQANLETHTIDRLTNLLFERPIAPSDEPPYEDSELASLRIEAIRTLSAIAGTKRGSIALAQHRTAVGRLFRFLHIQLTALYDLPLSSFPELEDILAPGPSTIQKLTTALISLTIRLIHHLMHHHADLINLREKLAIIPGGHHKFLVSLTRLAFSEQLVYESGIDEEAIDAAHEILDHVLTPEEGEAVVQAIETPRGSRASAPG